MEPQPSFTRPSKVGFSNSFTADNLKPIVPPAEKQAYDQIKAKIQEIVMSKMSLMKWEMSAPGLSSPSLEYLRERITKRGFNCECVEGKCHSAWDGGQFVESPTIKLNLPQEPKVEAEDKIPEDSWPENFKASYVRKSIHQAATEIYLTLCKQIETVMNVESPGYCEYEFDFKRDYSPIALQWIVEELKEKKFEVKLHEEYSSSWGDGPSFCMQSLNCKNPNGRMGKITAVL